MMSLRPISTDETVNAVRMIVDSNHQPLRVGNTITVSSQTPSTGKIIIHASNSSRIVNSTSKNVIQPTSNSGRITICKQEASSSEITPKMLKTYSRKPCIETTMTSFNETPTTSSNPVIYNNRKRSYGQTAPVVQKSPFRVFTKPISQESQLGGTVDVLNQTSQTTSQAPSTGQAIPVAKIEVINNTPDNVIQPTCGRGRITIGRKVTFTPETVAAGGKMLKTYGGFRKMKKSVENRVEASITMVNETVPSTSFEPQSPPISPEPEDPEDLAVPEPQYPYTSGFQFPPGIERPGRILNTVLTENPMIEVFSMETVDSDVTMCHYYTAYCHTCKKHYDRSTSAKLRDHVKTIRHKRCITLPQLMGVDDVKEQDRRLSLFSNKRFVPFLELHEDDHSLWCKWCNVQLPWDYKRINTHRFTVAHQGQAEDNEAVAITETEKLKKLRILISKYPNVLALVTEFDKQVNDLYFDYDKSPDEISLQVNDLYCKICRQKINSCNPSDFGKAVRSHVESKRHLKEVEKQQQQQSSSTDNPLRMKPRKISTYREKGRKRRRF